MAKTSSVLDLSEIHQNIYALTPNWKGVMEEASIIRLEEQGHQPGVSMEVDGAYRQTYQVIWRYSTNEDMLRCYQDDEQTTEWAACGIALLLVRKLTTHTAISRSRKGTGFDYWLGSQQDTELNIFQNKARLEISGICKGSESQVSRRLKEKINQPNPSDSTKLPVYAVVVEFSRPLSRIAQR